MNESPQCEQTVNLRGKAEVSLDSFRETLKELNSVAERIASKTVGWFESPECSDKMKEVTPSPSGFLNDFTDRVEKLHNKTRKIRNILIDVDNQL